MRSVIRVAQRRLDSLRYRTTIVWFRQCFAVGSFLTVRQVVTRENWILTHSRCFLVLSAVAIYYSYLIVNHHHQNKVRMRQPNHPPRRSRALSLSIIAILIAFCAPAIPISSAQTGAGGPEIVIGATRKDFGEVFAGEELEQNFPVFNNGKKPLELAQRSTLGSRLIQPSLPASAAVWRPNERLLTRTVATRRAAPS